MRSINPRSGSLSSRPSSRLSRLSIALVATLTTVATLATMVVATPAGSAPIAGPAGSAAAAGPAAPARIGTNLEGPADWTTEQPFIDQMKFSRPWISGVDGTWDDGRRIATDADGWVASLQPGQIARSVVLTDLTTYRPGVYDVTFTGRGDLQIQGATQVGPGHLQFSRTDGDGTTILTLVSTDPADPLRNIKITPPGGVCLNDRLTTVAGPAACSRGDYRSFVDHSDTLLFNPDFLARTAPYSLVRFMEWNLTNNSTQRTWGDRTEPTTAQWAVQGVPYEVQIALANQLKVDPWFNVPHLADDDYVRRLATLVRDRLDPGLIAHVEYTNEGWNSIFQQTRWLQEQGLRIEPDLANEPWVAGWHYYSRRSTEVHKLFVEVFGGRGRLHLATGSQSEVPYVSEQILGYGDTAAWTDSLAIAPYIGEVPSTEERAAQLRTTSVDAYFAEIETKILPATLKAITGNRAVADGFGVGLTAYEGGQHFVGTGGIENDAQVNALFDAVNRDPRMGDIYTRYLNAWEASGGGSFVHFVNVSRWSKWGRWGALTHINQPRSESPKFDALMRFIEARRPPTPPAPPAAAGRPATPTIPTTPTASTSPVGQMAEPFGRRGLLDGRKDGRGFASAWTAPGQPSDSYRMGRRSLSPGDLAASGGRLLGASGARGAGRLLGPLPAGERFVSVVLRPSRTGRAILSLHGAARVWRPGRAAVDVGYLGGRDRRWAVRIGGETEHTAARARPGRSALIVLRTRADGQVAEIWIDPPQTTDQRAPTKSAAKLRARLPQLTAVALRLGAGAAADEIRIGPSFASVTPRSR